MKCGNSFLHSPLVFSSALVLLVLLSMCGRMLLWSQSNEPLSNSSDKHLATWEMLSGSFILDLEKHEQTLKELGQKLQTSEANLQQLTPLYELSLQQNESLKTYNEQIAERMQEKDEDLAASYEVIDCKDKTILRLVIAVIILGIPYLIKVALWIAGKFRR
jgi:peptidoglycan hydrolase CwlO-like protein